MSALRGFRQQYPQYNDLSDADLADALHAKFYSDMPKDRYLQSLGMGAPANQEAPAAPAAPARPSAREAALQILQPGVPGGIATSSQPTQGAISTAPEPSPAPVDQPAAFGLMPGSGRDPVGPQRPEPARQGLRRSLMGDYVSQRVEGDAQPRVAVRTRVPIGETPNTAFDPAATPSIGTPGGTPQERQRLQDIGETYRDMPAVVRGAREGIEVMRRQNVGLQIFAADMLGLDAAGDASRANYERSNRATQSIGQSEDFWTRAVEGGVASIVGNVQSLAGGAGAGMMAAGRGAGAVASQASTGALASMGTLVFGDEYQAGREYGLSATEATTRALMMTAAEVIGERVGLKRLSESIGDMVRGATTAELPAAIARAVMQYGASQQVGEQLTYALQSGTDKFSPVGTNPEMTLAQYIQGAADTAAATLVQAGVMGAGGQAIGMGARALERRGPAPSATGTIGPGIDLLSGPGTPPAAATPTPSTPVAEGGGAISLLPGAAPAAPRALGPAAPAQEAAVPPPVEQQVEPPIATEPVAPAAPVAAAAPAAIAPEALPPAPDQVLPVLGEVTSVTLPSGVQVTGAVTGAEQNGAQWEVRVLADDGSRYVFTDQDGIQFAPPVAAPAAINPVAPVAADLPAAREPVGAIATAQPAVEPAAPVKPVVPPAPVAPEPAAESAPEPVVEVEPKPVVAEAAPTTPAETPTRAIQTERPKAPPKPTREQLANQVLAQMRSGNGVSTATVAGAAGVSRDEAEEAIKLATKMRRKERKKPKAQPAARTEYPPAPPKGSNTPAYIVPSQRAVVDFMNGDITRAQLHQKFADLDMAPGQVASVTNRIEWLQSDDAAVQALRKVDKSQAAAPATVIPEEDRTRILSSRKKVALAPPGKQEPEKAEVPAQAAPVPYANLDGKIVSITVPLEGGKTAKMRQDAGKAMRDIDDRLAALKALKACISGEK